uniref:Methyltransferase FkbM domain-containing protein n=1 Tax=Panagrolaimus sp. JU765 TaxID=591449 RepID=A0AC34RKG8_9BILA
MTFTNFRRPSSSNGTLLVFLAIFVICLIFFVRTIQQRNPTLIKIEETNNCLEKLLSSTGPETKYDKLPDSVDICTANFFNSLPILFLGTPKIEIKYFLRPINPYDNCDILTLGIGKEIYAELDLRRSMPQCNFVGVDPDLKSNGDFLEVLHGKLIEGAVGAKDGVYDASILDPKTGKYNSKQLSHISFEKVLKMGKLRQLIDLVLMDVEYAEYEIFDVIAENTNLTTFCQFNVEVHGEKPNLNQQYLKIIKNAGFLLLKNDGGGFHKQFWVNVKNPLCLKKYFGIE